MTLSRHGLQARRPVLLALGASVLVLAGCQSGPRGAAPGPASGPAPQPTATVHRVAVLVPLTGGEGAVGQSIANAATLALADTGDKTIRLTTYDTAQAGGAAAAMRRALGDGNGLVLGPLLSEDVRAAAPLARAADVPVIAFSNDESVAGGGVYLMGMAPDQSIDRVLAVARARGVGSVAALVPNGLYGDRAVAALGEAARRHGVTVAATERYDRTQLSVRGAAGRLARKSYDALLVADGATVAAAGASLAGKGKQLLGTELWATDRSLGKSAALRGAWFAAAPDGRFDQLTTRYRARYGKSPYRIASLGYDSVLLAVKSARSWTLGRPFPAKQLTDADGFAGVDGIFRFQRDGVAQRALEVRSVTATGTSVIAPAETRFTR